MAAPRITPNQRDRLIRLGNVSVISNERPGRWIKGRDIGGTAALEHLHAKGYIDREIRIGPMGGEHLYYRPNENGWAVIDRAREKARVAAGMMPVAEIDNRLCDARAKGAVVRIFLNGTEYRGIPGEVFRHPTTGALLLKFGAREISLRAITSVKSA